MMRVYFIATFIYCYFTNSLSCVSRFVSLSLLCCVQQSATLDPPLWEALALPLWGGVLILLTACPAPFPGVSVGPAVVFLPLHLCRHKYCSCTLRPEPHAPRVRCEKMVGFWISSWDDLLFVGAQVFLAVSHESSDASLLGIYRIKFWEG